jgi:DNA invertase Pin-like site-specific DNA recombinase
MTAAAAADLIRDAIIYLRLSDFRDEDDATFEARKAELLDLAASLRLRVIRVVIENDLNGNGKSRGASAYKTPLRVTAGGLHIWRTSRPEFRGVLLDLQGGSGLVLIVSDISRLARDERDGADLIDACASGRAWVLMPDDDGGPRWVLTSGGQPAEVDALKDRINDARRFSADVAAKVRRGRRRWAGKSYGGGIRPYGYRPDPDAPEHHKTLIIVPAEAAVIRQAAGDILERQISLKAVARDLRDRDVPTVTGAAWSARTLRDVLIKPAVAAQAVKQRDPETKKVIEYADAPWQPILERDTWERLRDLLDDPARRTNTGRANEPRWLVSGFATCGVCGGQLRAGGGRDRAHAYIGKDCCHVRRNAAAVDGFITDAVIAWLDKYADSGRLRPQAPADDPGAKALRAEARRLRARREKFRKLGATGDMEPADVAAMLRDIDAQLAAGRARLDAAASQPDPVAEFRGATVAAQAWEALPVARRRAVVQAIISHVTVLPAGRRGQGFDPASVDWDYTSAAGAVPAGQSAEAPYAQRG